MLSIEQLPCHIITPQSKGNYQNNINVWPSYSMCKLFTIVYVNE